MSKAEGLKVERRLEIIDKEIKDLKFEIIRLIRGNKNLCELSVKLCVLCG